MAAAPTHASELTTEVPWGRHMAPKAGLPEPREKASGTHSPLIAGWPL